MIERSFSVARTLARIGLEGGVLDVSQDEAGFRTFPEVACDPALDERQHLRFDSFEVLAERCAVFQRFTQLGGAL